MLEEAVTDSYKRLIKPSIETEFAAASKQKADDEAIRVFAQNLHQLLLAPPLGQKRVLGLDPGFRTGCKVVCLDAQGNLLHNEAIYPHPPRNEYAQAQRKLQKLVEQYDNVVARRGKGLMQGLVLTTPVIDTVNKAIEKGLLVISAGSDVLRMVPPLVITKENVDEMIEILSQCL